MSRPGKANTTETERNTQASKDASAKVGKQTTAKQEDRKANEEGRKQSSNQLIKQACKPRNKQANWLASSQSSKQTINKHELSTYVAKKVYKKQAIT